MVMLANQPPHLVCIRSLTLRLLPIAIPAPHREAQEELNT